MYVYQHDSLTSSYLFSHQCSVLPWVGRFFMKDLLAFLSLAMSLLTFLSFISLLIAPFHVFFGLPLGKLLLTLKVLYLLDQAFSSILYRWPNHCSLWFCKHSVVVFKLSLVLSYSEEISWDLTPELYNFNQPLFCI